MELLKYHKDKVNEQTPKKLTFVLMKNQNFNFNVKGLIKGTFVIYVWNKEKKIIEIERKNKNWIVLKSFG